MKRRILLLLMSVVVAYAIAYLISAQRRPTPLRNAGVFAHVREFRQDWQARMFYPAGVVEWAVIRANPRLFLPQPTWSAVPQILVLEGPMYKATIPPRALRRRNEAGH